MKTVNIGTLKSKLNSYLQDVKKGEEVIVQNRKKPNARIVPIKSADFTDEELYLVEHRRMIPPENPRGINWEAFWAAPRAEVSDEAVREAIDWVKAIARCERLFGIRAPSFQLLLAEGLDQGKGTGEKM